MSEGPKIIACRIFADELAAVCGPDLDVTWLPASLHMDLKRLEAELTKAMEQTQAEPGQLLLLYGVGCHPDLSEFARGRAVFSAQYKNCLHLFLGDELAELEKRRTIVMTPAWIRSFMDMATAAGWDNTDMRTHLGRYDTVLVMDPGLNPLSDEEVLEFFDLVGVPVAVRPMNLAGFARRLGDLLQQVGNSDA